MAKRMFATNPTRWFLFDCMFYVFIGYEDFPPAVSLVDADVEEPKAVEEDGFLRGSKL